MITCLLASTAFPHLHRYGTSQPSSRFQQRGQYRDQRLESAVAAEDRRDKAGGARNDNPGDNDEQRYAGRLHGSDAGTCHSQHLIFL